MTNTTALYYMYGHIDQSGRCSEYTLPDEGTYGFEVNLTQEEYEQVLELSNTLKMDLSTLLKSTIAKELKKERGG